MPIIVHSPYSGRPVKIRDQDIGRSIRDEEGRIFYAVPKSDGNGYYGAPTRAGSEKDEQRYAEMLVKSGRAEAISREKVLAVHDATGKGRGGAGRLVGLLVLLALLAGGVAAVLDFTGIVDVPFIDLDSTLDIPTLPGDGDSPLPGTAPQLPDTGPPQPQSFGPSGELRGVQALGFIFDPPEPLYDADPPLPEAAAPETAATPAATQLGSAPAAPVALANATLTTTLAESTTQTPFTTTASGLKWRPLVPGATTGPTAAAGNYVLIHYDATLPGAAAVIDTSRTDPDAAPIGFVLWSGQVIRGWDEGIAGMRVGETRELIIPPSLISPESQVPSPASAATGDSGLGTWDASSFGLRFEIELIDVLPGIASETTRAGRVGGRTATPGSTVEVHYMAFLDGQPIPFDHSRTRPSSHHADPEAAALAATEGPGASPPQLQEGSPFRFPLGAGQVILGWDLGIAGMKEGEVRNLVIPPYLAYGHRGVGTVIPPNATLRYEIELVRVLD